MTKSSDIDNELKSDDVFTNYDNYISTGGIFYG